MPPAEALSHADPARAVSARLTVLLISQKDYEHDRVKHGDVRLVLWDGGRAVVKGQVQDVTRPHGRAARHPRLGESRPTTNSLTDTALCFPLQVFLPFSPIFIKKNPPGRQMRCNHEWTRIDTVLVCRVAACPTILAKRYTQYAICYTSTAKR